MVLALQILAGALWKYAKLVTVDYVEGVSFPAVARAASLLLAFSALVLGIIFIATLSPEGRLPLGEGLTFVGLLLTAASFFANAGRPN
jgi:1,4-dihydroxy-2-naphthoate octaprenyltransferase